MPPATRPPYDEQRVESLRRLNLLDTPPEERFDRLMRVARSRFNTGAALITLVDVDRQWFKSCYGMQGEGTDRDAAFCSYTVQGEDTLVVNDARLDPRFRDNPLVTGEPHIRFYAGHPIHAPDLQRIGSLCVIDFVPRTFDERDLRDLEDIAHAVESEVMHTDTSELVRGVQAIRNYLDAFYAAVPDPVLVFDARGIVVAASPAAERVLGYADRPLVGEPLPIDADTAAVAAALDEIDAAEHGLSFSVEARRANGDLFPVEASVRRAVISGRPMYVCSARDVSEKRAEAARLQQAYESLERLDQVKSEFVGIVSHEFRTALTGIQGFSELMRDNDFTVAEMKEFAGDIHKDALRLNRLINQMLDLDRMEAGGIPLSCVDVDVNALVREQVAHFAAAHPTRAVSFEAASAVPPVRADPDRLVQVVANLLSNAAKYSSEASPIEVRTSLYGRNVQVAVADHGRGIAAEDQERIFQRYGRVQETAGIKGTGLGLPIVKEIAKLHGGAVWVESTVGRGSTFVFSIPVAGPAEALH